MSGPFLSLSVFLGGWAEPSLSVLPQRYLILCLSSFLSHPLSITHFLVRAVCLPGHSLVSLTTTHKKIILDMRKDFTSSFVEKRVSLHLETTLSVCILCLYYSLYFSLYSQQNKWTNRKTQNDQTKMKPKTMGGYGKLKIL